MEGDHDSSRMGPYYPDVICHEAETSLSGHQRDLYRRIVAGAYVTLFLPHQARITQNQYIQTEARRLFRTKRCFLAHQSLNLLSNCLTYRDSMHAIETCITRGIGSAASCIPEARATPPAQHRGPTDRQEGGASWGSFAPLTMSWSGSPPYRAVITSCLEGWEKREMGELPTMACRVTKRSRSSRSSAELEK